MLSLNMKLTIEFKESKCCNDGILFFDDGITDFNRTMFSCGNPWTNCVNILIFS